MGFVKVKVGVEKVAGPSARRATELLGDTGALHSMVPARLLRELGIEPRKRLTFELADGTTIDREVGEARFFYDGRDAVPPVIFGGETDAGVVGVVTLEAMGLEVDSVRHRVRPTRLIMY